MEAARHGSAVVVEAGRERLYDARGYGRPHETDGVELAPVEAAHLLFRGDLDAVDGLGFEAFFEAQTDGFGTRFLVYSDLRARGYYLSPARAGWVADPAGIDFVVHPRGTGPADGESEYRVRVAGERASVPSSALGEVVLAVADEEGEVTYFATDHPELSGAGAPRPDEARGVLLADRVVLWDPPPDLHRRGFYGQPIPDRDAAAAIQLSLVEAAYLVAEGALSLGVDAATVVERGRAVEGARFDRRLAAYTTLRASGTVPKTGFKFGADFRVYSAVESVDDLGHSEDLVRVLPSGYAFTPRELALDVRLASGVRKRLVYALVDDEIEWLSVGRLTP